VGNPAEETTTTERDKHAKAGRCGQAPCRVADLVTVALTARHTINIEVGHGTGS